MRAYFQLFFGLLVPLSGLFMATAFTYFNTGYTFTKALRLGVLSGFFIAIAVSLFTALFILIMRRGKKPEKSILTRRKRSKTKAPKTADSIPDAINIPTTDTSSTETLADEQNIAVDDKSIEQKMMLLMDKDIAFEVALHAISEQHIGILTKSINEEDNITIKNDDEVLHLTISTLTRHTSQVSIKSEINSVAAKKIIRYMKDKEHSFLQY